MALRDDIRSILLNVRERDRCELVEYGLDVEAAVETFALPAVAARLFKACGVPAAFVTFHRLTPRALVVSMMATYDWRQVAGQVVRWGWREARPSLIAQGYTRAECRTLEGHADAIELLERLGFVRECRLPGFGAHGASFLQYAWRLIDHVHVQIPQGPAAAVPGIEAGRGTE